MLTSISRSGHCLHLILHHASSALKSVIFWHNIYNPCMEQTRLGDSEGGVEPQ